MIDGAERPVIFQVYEHEGTHPETDTVVIPAPVNPIPVFFFPGTVKPGNRCVGIYPVPVSEGFNRSRAHGCAAETASHASPGVFADSLGCQRPEIQDLIQAPIGFEKCSKVCNRKIIVAVLHEL
jgi:hypothetical protein